MKRIFSFILTVVTSLVFLTSCGNSSDKALMGYNKYLFKNKNEILLSLKISEDDAKVVEKEGIQLPGTVKICGDDFSTILKLNKDEKLQGYKYAEIFDNDAETAIKTYEKILDDITKQFGKTNSPLDSRTYSLVKNPLEEISKDNKTLYEMWALKEIEIEKDYYLALVAEIKNLGNGKISVSLNYYPEKK